LIKGAGAGAGAAAAAAARLRRRKIEPVIMPTRRINPNDMPTPSPIAKASDFFDPGEGEGFGVEVTVGDGEEPLRLSAGTPA